MNQKGLTPLFVVAAVAFAMIAVAAFTVYHFAYRANNNISLEAGANQTGLLPGAANQQFLAAGQSSSGGQSSTIGAFGPSETIISSSPIATTGGAFAGSPKDNVFLPNSETNNASGGAGNGSALPGNNKETSTFLGVTTNPAPTNPPPHSSANINQLPLPDVSDAELTIDAAGASSSLAYIIFFNNHYKDIVFDGNQFSTVLKDENGIPLFIPSLAGKAIADNNFSEIKNSIIIQKKFANAEIVFMRSIKVTGDAIILNKKAIGAEELTVDLADKALAVASGAASQKEFGDFYASFSLTASQANGWYVDTMRALASAQKNSPTNNPFSFLWDTLGLGAVAHAQVPFGGPVLAIFPMPFLFGSYVTIGPPVPTIVFVPWAFLASPLFFPTKTFAVGSWWLGLYSAGTQTIIMTGTSLVP